MAEPTRDAVFADSSVQIARTIREPAMRARINAWLAQYKLKISGLVAIQEFKNRVLRDIAYLLDKLHKTGSYRDTLDYVTNVLPRPQERKRNICVTALHRILEGRPDGELTERARLYLRTLLMHGTNQVVAQLDYVAPTISCYWALVPVQERRRYVSYDLGYKFCSKSNRQCQIGVSLAAKQDVCVELLNFLTALPADRTTGELGSAASFLERIVNGNALANIFAEEPCWTAGDLLLALSSERVPAFYTMNYRESQAYCDFFNQDLSVRPNDPAQDERTFPKDTKPWPTL
jgi:hypothetical protein